MKKHNYKYPKSLYMCEGCNEASYDTNCYEANELIWWNGKYYKLLNSKIFSKTLEGWYCTNCVISNGDYWQYDLGIIKLEDLGISLEDYLYDQYLGNI